MDDKNLFFRDFDLENTATPVTLRIFQNQVGDVGAVVWDSALVACKYFERLNERKSEDFSGKTVLELGAGTGICSLALSCLGANVIATDLPEQLPLLERNREFNTRNFKGSVKVLPLTWGNAADIDRLKSERFDWILIIDCLYYEMSTKPLIETLRALSTPKETKILCVYEEREVGKPKLIVEEFFQIAKEHFRISPIPDEELHPDYIAPEIKTMILSLEK